jgi:hypothetical protein
MCDCVAAELLDGVAHPGTHSPITTFTVGGGVRRGGRSDDVREERRHGAEFVALDSSGGVRCPRRGRRWRRRCRRWRWRRGWGRGWRWRVLPPARQPRPSGAGRSAASRQAGCATPAEQAALDLDRVAPTMITSPGCRRRGLELLAVDHRPIQGAEISDLQRRVGRAHDCMPAEISGSSIVMSGRFGREPSLRPARTARLRADRPSCEGRTFAASLVSRVRRLTSRRSS